MAARTKQQTADPGAAILAALQAAGIDLAALTAAAAPAAPAKPEPKQEQGKSVKAENAGLPPTNAQFYRLCMAARDAELLSFVMPVNRADAATLIGAVAKQRTKQQKRQTLQSFGQ